MAPNRITVEGVGGVKLSNDDELDKWLNKKSAECLLDSDGDQVVGFATLVDGGNYTLGPPQQQSPPQPNGESDVFDYSDVDVSVCRLKDDLLVESGLEDYDNAAIACEGKVDVTKILKDLDYVRASNPFGDNAAAPFSCIFASSGTGKTQLAATAARVHAGRTIYLYVGSQSMATLQSFYQPHAPLWARLLSAVKDFMSEKTEIHLFKTISREGRGAHDILTYMTKDASCPLFILLHKILFESDSPNATLSMLRARVLSKEENMLVFLDEVPGGDSRWFSEVMVLGNVLRAIGICPILMSTNSGAQNAVQSGTNSRDGDRGVWCRVFVKLPKFQTPPQNPAASGWLGENERPLISTLVLQHCSVELTPLVRLCGRYLQERKRKAWTGNPAFQLCQLFRTKKAEGSEEKAAHKLVGQHFGSFCIGGNTIYEELDRETQLQVKNWKVRMVVPDDEPILFLALTSWKLEDVSATSKHFFPLVDKQANAISVREAFNKSADDFKSNIYKANPAAEKLDGDDLEVIALASVTLASLQCDAGVSCGVGLAQFVSSVYHFMTPGRLYESIIETTTKAVELLLAQLYKLNSTFLNITVPACPCAESSLDLDGMAQTPPSPFGKVKRPPDREMRDGSVSNSEGTTVVHVECKNLKGGLTTKILANVVERMRANCKVSLLFTSELNGLFAKQGAWPTLMASMDLHKHAICFLVLAQGQTPYWLKTAGDNIEHAPTSDTTHLAILISTIPVV